jgi:peptide/nickel transport system substrate-binding protein
MSGVKRARLWPALVGCAALMLASCAPAGSASRQSGPADGQMSSPKTLRMGMIAGSEPTENIPLGSGGTGGGEHPFMLHAGLTIYDSQGTLLPHLAQRVPTIENGDWRVSPDGQMEVTWRLRPDLTWHDGTPLTAADFAFGLQVARDPDMQIRRQRALSFIVDATPPDPSTIVVRWKQLYSFANVSGAMDAPTPALPRHLLPDLYSQPDKQELVNSPYWTREFVGLGPYRLGEWVQASQMELLAFDQYFLGRPKIDRVIVRYFGDANVVVAGLLSGDIDMTPMGAMKAEQLVAVKNAWDPTGVGTAYAQVGGARNYRFQYRDASAPWAQDVRVRQALIHMLDRQTIADTLVYGLTKPADTLPPPEDPIYGALDQKGFARYGYDLSRGQQLLAEAGWTRGSDGLYRSASGQLFDLEVRTSGKTDNVREGQALASEWKSAGINATPFAFADNAANKDELKAVYPGLLGWPLDFSPEAMQNWISSQIPTQAGGWKGSNFGGYVNQKFDSVYDEQLVALEAPKRQSLFADLLKILADDAVSVFLYYDTSTYTVAYRKGIRGVTRVPSLQQINAWNIQTWEMD